MYRLIIGIIASFICSLTNALAQDESALDIATSYVEAYSRLDIETLGALASDDIVFVDRTAPDAQGARVGRQAVVDGFRALESRGAFDLAFVPEHVFESNNIAVFVGPMDAQFHLADGGVYHWTATVVMTLRIENGHVVEHVDFADYRGAREYIEPAAANQP